MRLIKAMLIFLLSLSAWADFDCQSEFLREVKDLLKSEHQHILAMQLEITTLKLAIKANQNQKSNLEALVREYSRKLKSQDQGTLHKLQEIYSKYGEKQDYQKILENFKQASYWNGKSRFYNDDISMFITAKRLLDPNEKSLDKMDSAITWFAHRLSKEIDPNHSSAFNLSNISSHVAWLSGGVKEKTPKKELVTRLNKLKQKIKEAFNALKDDLSESFKRFCMDKNGNIQSCNMADAFYDWSANAIEDLSKNINENDLYKVTLRDTITQKFDGKIEFKITPNLERIAELKQPPPKPIILKKNSFQAIQNWQKELNQLPDEMKIRAFHQQMKAGSYGILDKSLGVLSLYNKSGLLLSTIEAPQNQSHNDQRKFSHGGIYRFEGAEFDHLKTSDQRGRKGKINYQQNSQNCDSELCFSSAAIMDMAKHLLPGDPIYVLPYDKNNHFIVKNMALNFTTDLKGIPYFNYNFSPKGKKIFPIKFKINKPEYNTPVARKFLKTLEKEKANLINLYGLDNDEYNELAIYAFGILGNESAFGDNFRYEVKETFPWGVAYLKGWKRGVIDPALKDLKKEEGTWEGIKSGISTYFKEMMEFNVELFSGKVDGSSNSRGPTQIKKIPHEIKGFYNFKKKDLKKPENAAVATLGFLAQSLRELKIKAKKNPDITKDNLMDYLHYIYMGSSHEIINQTATPEKNIYLRQLKAYVKGLELTQES